MSATAHVLADLRSIPQFKALKPRQKRFLSVYLRHDCKVEPAAKAMGLEPKTHYNWLTNPDYVHAIDMAKQFYGDILEADMFSRALEGYDKPVIYQGEITGYYREWNVEERKFILKGLKPQYRDNYTLFSASGPAKVQIVLQAPNEPQAIDITPDSASKPILPDKQ